MIPFPVLGSHFSQLSAWYHSSDSAFAFSRGVSLTGYRLVLVLLRLSTYCLIGALSARICSAMPECSSFQWKAALLASSQMSIRGIKASISS
jgi:hypothetical protein